MFETAWISDRDGPGEAVCEFDSVELLLDCLPQFDLVDVAQEILWRNRYLCAFRAVIG